MSNDDVEDAGDAVELNDTCNSFFTAARHEFQKTRKLDSFHNNIGTWRKKDL